MCWIVSKIFPDPLHTMCAGGVSMCRKNQLLGVGIIAFGLGLLTATFFESGLFCGCIGVGMLICGIMLLQKK